MGFYFISRAHRQSPFISGHASSDTLLDFIRCWFAAIIHLHSQHKSNPQEIGQMSACYAQCACWQVPDWLGAMAVWHCTAGVQISTNDPQLQAEGPALNNSTSPVHRSAPLQAQRTLTSSSSSSSGTKLSSPHHYTHAPPASPAQT